MKTLKELLFERRRAAEPDLDQVRRRVLARLESPQTPPRREGSYFELLWREYVVPLRWHLAGMSAAWLLVVLLNVESPPASAALVAKAKVPSPRQLLAALRENRQEILDLTGSPPVASMPLPPRRSDVLRDTTIA